MRNTEERVAAVKLRAMEISGKKRIRRGRIIGISSAAACLMLITGLSFAMPGIMKKLPGDSYAYPGLTASIFDESGLLGYILIGLLAFTLGVCFTILCYRINLHNRKQEKEPKKQKQEDNDDRAD